MTVSTDAPRAVRLADALLRANVHPRDAAVGVGACGALYFAALVAIDLASAPTSAPGHGASASLALARGLTALVAVAAALVAPTQASAALARDRLSGGFDLAREAEASPVRRLAAYTFAPLWPAAFAVLAAFAASAPFACDERLSALGWAGWCAAALAFQALSAVVATAWALMIPRVTPTSQGVGVTAPLALSLAVAVAGMTVRTAALPLALLVIAAAAAAHWPVARALVARPERPYHTPVAAVATASGGLALAGVAWAFPSPQGPSAPWFGAWAILVAAAAGAWTLPRGGRLALALREGRGPAGVVAVSTALAVSALFAAGAAAVTSRVAPSPRALFEGAAFVAAASAALTAGLVVILSAPPARRGAWAGRAVLVGFTALLVEAALARSGSGLAARLDPLASLWTRADVAEGQWARVAMFGGAVVAALAVASAVWSRASRRITAAIDAA